MTTTALLRIYKAVVYGPHTGCGDEDTHELFIACEAFDEVVDFVKESFDDPMIESVCEINGSWPVYVSDAVLSSMIEQRKAAKR